MRFGKRCLGLVLLLVILSAGLISWGQFASRENVFVTVPAWTARLQDLEGGLSRADFELQGVVPVAHDLTFPTGIVCAPDRTLYVAEFSRFSRVEEGSAVRTDEAPEARIVAYNRKGERQRVLARLPATFVRSLALGPDGALYAGTGAWPEEKATFTGVWRLEPGASSPQPVQVIAPAALLEVLETFEKTLNPRPPEVRQVTVLTGGPFAGDLLFTAGAGTLADYALYRAPVSGASVGPPQKVALRGPWHNVAAGPEGALFASDTLNGFIARVSPDLSAFEPFAELVEPFYLAPASAETLYLTNHEFDNLINGKKPSTLWRLRGAERLPLGAAGAWGVAVCP